TRERMAAHHRTWLECQKVPSVFALIVAVSDFNMGAMENMGLNIFNDKYVLASQATATDADFANIEAVVAHEYFHKRTGNGISWPTRGAGPRTRARRNPNFWPT